MKINHIIDKDFKHSNTWRFYWNNEIKHSESTSEIYELRIYRYKENSTFCHRYKLCSYKRNHQKNILDTYSKEEINIILDLMGLRIENINIFITEKSTRNINVTGALIELT